MKHLAIILVLALLAGVVAVGWVYLNARVTIEAVGVIATEAASQQSLFDSLQSQQAEGALVGTAFTTEPLGEASDYQFYSYTVRLKNNCFLPADMVELTVTPMSGDVLQMGDPTPKVLQARTTGDITATILTKVGMHATRELNVTWYMWGIPFSIKTAYGK